MTTSASLRHGSVRCHKKPQAEAAALPSKMMMGLAPVELCGVTAIREAVAQHGACALLRRLAVRIALRAPLTHAQPAKSTRAEVPSNCPGIIIMDSSVKSSVATNQFSSTIHNGLPLTQLWHGRHRSGSGSLAGRASHRLARYASQVAMRSSLGRKRPARQTRQPTGSTVWAGSPMSSMAALNVAGPGMGSVITALTAGCASTNTSVAFWVSTRWRRVGQRMIIFSALISKTMLLHRPLSAEHLSRRGGSFG